MTETLATAKGRVVKGASRGPMLGATVATLALVAACGGGSTSPAANLPAPTAGTTTHALQLTKAPHSGPTSSGSTTSTRPSSQPITSAPSTSPPPTSPPATEFSPPGDIPDDQVFVPYSPPGEALRVSVPEGWARSSQHGVVTFTDKLNSIGIQVVPQPSAPTVGSATRTEVPQLAASVSQYAAGDVSSVTRQAGPVVLITYQQDSAPDPVTGKVIRDAVERYEFWHAGREAIITLSGPEGADNVDPWRIVSDSVSWPR